MSLTCSATNHRQASRAPTAQTLTTFPVGRTPAPWGRGPASELGGRTLLRVRTRGGVTEGVASSVSFTRGAGALSGGAAFREPMRVGRVRRLATTSLSSTRARSARQRFGVTDGRPPSLGTSTAARAVRLAPLPPEGVGCAFVEAERGCTQPHQVSTSTPASALQETLISSERRVTTKSRGLAAVPT